MQKAITVLGIEEAMNDKKRDRYRRLILEKCSPLDIYYDDDGADGSDATQKVTIQIKVRIEEKKEN